MVAVRIRRLAAAAALVPFVLAACSRPATPQAAAPSAPSSPIALPTAVPAQQPASPLPPHGTYTALSPHRLLQVWKHPGSGDPSFSLFTVNPVGQRLQLLVTDSMVDGDGTAWLRVQIPERPNGRTGWVHAADVKLVEAHEKIVVDLSQRMLWHYVDGELVDRFGVAIGAPGTPTPTGTFFVWAQVPQASPLGPYGVFALGLSGFAPTLSEWPGGGRIAIHGTSVASDVGAEVSHGCVRVYNPDMQTLRRVPLGTPVIIRR